ncbi:MAG: glycosyltransferase, partial [Candidatus Binatia bacterium]
TDVYRDIHRDPRARAILGRAWRIIVLQPLARDELPRRLRSRVRVIYQSAPPPHRRRRHAGGTFDVCVIGHLRPEKDPLRAAMAVRRLPESSRIRVLHAGKAMSSGIGRRARRETARNPRYRWLGEIRPGEARALLARSRLMVLSSRMEGGANVVSEALAARVPILASRIAGSEGLLGPAYPGFFPVGATRELAALLSRAEKDALFLAGLARACARRAWITSVRREKESWRRLLATLPRQPRRSTKTKTPGRRRGLLAKEARGWA